MVSTMGTARGTTQGSCRPLASSTPDEPSYLAVCCSCEIVAGGLNPTLRVSGFPRFDEANLPEVDVLSVGDTSLDSSTPVRLGAKTLLARQAVCAIDEGVVVCAAWESGSTESGSNLEAFCRRNRQHGMGEDSLELVESGLTESERAVSNDTDNGTTHRVVVGLGRADSLDVSCALRLSLANLPPPSVDSSLGEDTW